MEVPVTHAGEPDSLFERWAWFYALCREYLFRDHTDEIRSSLLTESVEAEEARLLELGCGPGFYSCRLAAASPQVRAMGVDLSENLLRRARRRAALRRLRNCHFVCADAHKLPLEDASVHGVIVSRLFLILADKEQVISEIHRVLADGGRCFIAEPTKGFRTRIPLAVMWALSKMTPGPAGKYREPRQVEIMPRAAFRAMVESQRWGSVEFSDDGWYQYAVCEKNVAQESMAELRAAG
jgi:ubiquinone/menaquinone biosynthesis C-methylase UbiE